MTSSGEAERFFFGFLKVSILRVVTKLLLQTLPHFDNVLPIISIPFVLSRTTSFISHFRFSFESYVYGLVWKFSFVIELYYRLLD